MYKYQGHGGHWGHGVNLHQQSAVEGWEVGGGRVGCRRAGDVQGGASGSLRGPSMQPRRPVAVHL